MKSTLRLFNAVLVDNKVNNHASESVLSRTLKNGYVLDPAIKPTKSLLNTIERTVGLSGKHVNAAFHKSWKTISESSIESLVFQQLMHYFSTYGAEALGVYHSDWVYVPHEKLEIPELKSDVPVIVIRGMNKSEMLDAILELSSGIALAEETLDDIMSIVEANRYDAAFVERVQNRELKARLYDFYGIVPSDPVEFLRHLISKLTDESLLIKSDNLIKKIKEANGKFVDELLKQAPGDLASIFYRYKPLFLAMKSISRNKTFFNRLRRDATTMHRPMPVDYLNDVTAQIKFGKLDLEKLSGFMERATIFRKIRLAYALHHRLQAGKSIVYRVRNGRGWATDFDWPADVAKQTQQAFDIVLNSIASNLRSGLDGKTVYIPQHVGYALPATEKQFTGNFPTGSYVSVPEDLIVGVHWWNTKKRVDLDLSVIGQSGKVGWDAAYRTDDRSVLFSGDMTDAPEPNGATELFYIRKQIGEPKLLIVNFFNFATGDEVRAKIIAASESPKKFELNYMVDPNNIVGSADINVNRKQMILGLIANVEGQNRVYFANTSIGNSISSSKNSHTTHARKFLFEKMVNTIDFRMILSLAGAIIVDEKPEGEHIDLSPTSLDKRTFMGLLNGQLDGQPVPANAL